MCRQFFFSCKKHKNCKNIVTQGTMAIVIDYRLEKTFLCVCVFDKIYGRSDMRQKERELFMSLSFHRMQLFFSMISHLHFHCVFTCVSKMKIFTQAKTKKKTSQFIFTSVFVMPQCNMSTHSIPNSEIESSLLKQQK